MNIVPIETPAYETVTLASAVDLRRVAEWAGTPVQTIQDLNPELRRWTTPLRATDYELKVPEGAAAIVNARMLDAAVQDLAPLNLHTVKKGETLLSISKKLKVSRTDLAEANYLSTKATLKAGQQLIIPRAPTLLLAATTQTATSSGVVDAAPAVDVTAVSQPVVQPAVAEAKVDSVPEKIIHRVKRGDTLFSIARRYDTTVEELKEWNRLRSSSIQIGQRLTIFRDSGPSTN
jgi:membrane-bound lytic murein transglycosylase D